MQHEGKEAPATPTHSHGATSSIPRLRRHEQREDSLVAASASIPTTAQPAGATPARLKQEARRLTKMKRGGGHGLAHLALGGEALVVVAELLSTRCSRTAAVEEEEEDDEADEVAAPATRS